MKLLEVLVERTLQQLDRPFTYYYDGFQKVVPGVRVLIPFNHQTLVGYVLKVDEIDGTLETLKSKTNFQIHSITTILDVEPLLNEELMTLASSWSLHYFWPQISVLQAMLPPSLKPRKSSLKSPGIAFESYIRVLDQTEDDLTLKQIEWLRAIKKEELFRKKDGPSTSLLSVLIKKKKVEVFQKEKNRFVLPNLELDIRHQLTNDQKKVVEEVLSTNETVFLLEGVTGSGKTEVYLALSEKILSLGKSVLMIVPEIALTPMMVAYFSKRFANQVAILHSELTPAEKYDEYRRIAKGDARVVVGARSAVFAPLKNIGLVVLDEEHVESYKQDNLPFYHARDIAIERAKYHHAKVILGSATPSLESKARALKGLYHQLTLPNRINQKELPATTIIDMLQPKNVDRSSSIFSIQLKSAIQETLEKKNQIVLLINRRGYSASISCRKCGRMFKCPDCLISMAYHRDENMLKCHHCNHVESYPSTCPDCGSTHFIVQGFGTQRIMEEVNRLFPSARCLRLDSDVSKVRLSISKVLDKFRHGEADILIGTQMIAKGHDFPNVTLVGLVLADIGLTLPSYRSSERTFQLITQAVGRAGRAEIVGKAIIQTYNPRHYAVVLGAKQDYEAFFLREMQERKASQYPPYSNLISLKVEGKSEELVVDTAFAISNNLNEKLQENATILGPTTPFVNFLGGVYRRIIIIKYKKYDVVAPIIKSTIELLTAKTVIRLYVNVDPYDI